MDPLDIVYTVVFGVFVFCIVAPPNEVVSAGVTLETMFGWLLGNENTHFVEYHLRRTTLSRIFYSFFGIIYLAFMLCVSPDLFGEIPHWHAPITTLDMFFWIAVTVPLFFCSHTFLSWYTGGDWMGHPTMQHLKQLASSRSDLEAVEGLPENISLRSLIESVNSEYRQGDKFVLGSGQGTASAHWPGHRLAFTHSWILFSHWTTLRVIPQSSTRLTAVVVAANSVLDPNSNTERGRPAGENLGLQTMVRVRIADVTTGACILTFSLPANNLDTLRGNLRCPLIRAEGVQVEPTVVQQFLKVFTDVVTENEAAPVTTGADIEPCLGCMSQKANVMLLRRCAPVGSTTTTGIESAPQLDVPPCGQCRCRPMWCLQCLGRWFASRQIESHRHTSTWLSGRVPCPTCRSTFCVRDVAQLKAAEE